MSDLKASVALFSVLCIGVVVAATLRMKGTGLDPRARAKWQLATWGVVAAVGVAIWLIARSQIPG